MVVRKGCWRGGKEKKDCLQTDEGGNRSMRILVNCYQGRTRSFEDEEDTSQSPNEAAPSLFEENRGVPRESSEHDFKGRNVTEIVQRWLQVLCGTDKQQQVFQ